MAHTVEDLRDRVAPTAGVGRYGHDFGPNDWRTVSTRKRLLDVNSGNKHLRWKEVEQLLTRALTGR